MDIAIIGAGPSGMMAGIQASKNHNNNVYLFEKNEKLGKKLFITGKGRCNITNYCDLDNFKNNIVTNKKFLFHSLNEFDNIKFYDFLVDNGMELKIERGNRVFPLSDKSYELTDLYKKLLIKNNVQLKYNTNIDKILFNNNKFEIHYNNSFKLFDNVIIATGGMSYPSTGSTGDGYKFAKDFGIDIIEPKPSLVPIIVEENNELISIGRLLLKNIKIKIIDNNKTIYSDFGDIEFRNDEIAGPLIIKLSSLLCKDIKNKILSIDLKPALDEKKIKNRIIRDINENPNNNIIDELKLLIPTQILDSFYNRLKEEIDENLLNKNLANLNSIVINKIIELLKNYTFNIIGTKGFNEAIITKGGINVKELNPKTMESKKIKGLYFCGEVLDIDALTGGYNITIASITGYIAGNSCDQSNY